MRQWTTLGWTAVAAALLAPAPVSASNGEIEVNAATAAVGGVTGNLESDPPGLPVVITEPGSYRLTGSLSVASPDETAIQITANDVTLDLAGFRLRGPVVCSGPLPTTCAASGSGRGVDGATARGVRVHGGNVMGFGGGGIVLGAHAQVEDVVARSNAGSGIEVGVGSLVRNSVARGNGQRGVIAGNASAVDRVVGSENGSTGVEAGSESVVTGSFVENNDGSGVRAGAASVVASAITGYNARSGVVLLGSGQLSESLAHGHALYCGFSVGPNALLRNNLTASNGRGFFANANSSALTGYQGNVLADAVALGYREGEVGPVDLGQNGCQGGGACGTITLPNELTCE